MDQQQIDEEHQEHGASIRTYVAIAVVLTVFTIIEVLMPQYMDQGATLVVTLLTLAFVKAGLVVAFYMHLKFDSRTYTGVLALALVLALFLLGMLVWSVL